MMPKPPQYPRPAKRRHPVAILRPGWRRSNNFYPHFECVQTARPIQQEKFVCPLNRYLNGILQRTGPETGPDIPTMRLIEVTIVVPNHA